MRTMPYFVFRGTLLMVFFMVIACLALTRGTTPASSDAENNPAMDANPEIQTGEAEMPPNEGCELSAHFPQSVLQWCELIAHCADQHNLPADLIAALIWQESGGNPSAYSSSGAVGLMQVMPRDGLAAAFMCANGPCFAARPAINELQDPEFNIEYGTRMLAGLLARHQDWREALKRYGPYDVGYAYADIVLSLYSQASP
jgi:soluble lytic murein transglycosylase-like protein